MNTNISQLALCKTLSILTAQRLMMRKSTWALALVGLFPASIALFWITKNLIGFQSNDLPYGIYRYIMSFFFLTFYVPILAIFLGLGVLSDEIETNNLTFTLIRPLARWNIAIGRLFGHYIVGVGLLFLGLVVTYLANMVFQVEALFSQLPHLGNAFFVLSYGLFAYLGIIAAFGTIWKKFAILASFLWLIFDTLFSMLPVPNFNAISIKFRMFRGFWEPAAQFLPSISIPQGSALVQALICGLFTLAGTAVIIWRLTTLEVTLSNGAN